MRMLIIIKGVTLRDNATSVDIRKEEGVKNINKKVREIRHMQKKEENNEVRAIVDMILPGKGPRGSPRGGWMDCVRRDMQELRITPEDA